MKPAADLYTRGDSNSGDTRYFADEGLTIPYTGIVYDSFNGKIHILFELKEGIKDGIEKIYHENSEILQQVSEYRNNLQFGISKEYDEEERLVFVSVVWNNMYLKTLSVHNGDIIEYSEDLPLKPIHYPEQIQALLKLTDTALINYQYA